MARRGCDLRTRIHWRPWLIYLDLYFRQEGKLMDYRRDTNEDLAKILVHDLREQIRGGRLSIPEYSRNVEIFTGRPPSFFHEVVVPVLRGIFAWFQRKLD